MLFFFFFLPQVLRGNWTSLPRSVSVMKDQNMKVFIVYSFFLVSFNLTLLLSPALVEKRVAEAKESGVYGSPFLMLPRVPLAVFELHNLTIMSVHQNLLEEIPPAISRLSALQELRLNCNSIRELPDEIGATLHHCYFLLFHLLLFACNRSPHCLACA